MWGIGRESPGLIEVTVPAGVLRRRPGITVHRSLHFDEKDMTSRYGIPVMTATRTLIDRAAGLPMRQLDAELGEADRLGLTNPAALHATLVRLSNCPGAAALRKLLAHQAFALTHSELERIFVRIAREAGLGRPETQVEMNGYRVDFFWRDLGLVVETDGLRYHRTPAQQARDRIRDQVHLMAGLIPLRFTHAQVAFQRGYVRATLVRLSRRLQRRA